MTEFIITSEQLEIAIEAIAYDLSKPINEVYIRREKLPEIVRCRDCRHSSREYKEFRYCYRLGECKEFFVEPDGFCAWGERGVDE